MRNKKQGISLIVLVITIMVMIILASAVVITLNNTGIISKTSKATNESDLNNVQQLASLAWMDAYLAQMESTDIDLEEEILKALNKNNIDTTKYDIEVTNKGVTVKIKDAILENEEANNDNELIAVAGNWTLQTTKNSSNKVTAANVTNGIQTIEVGTTVNYMPDGVGPNDKKYTGGWKILGTDDMGRLLIMSNSSVSGDKLALGGNTLNTATKCYLDALILLQSKVNDYVDGRIGIKVRSMHEDDIAALTLYDKTTYGAGISKYGNEITYTWNGTNAHPIYSYGNGSTGTLNNDHSNGFTYYDVKNDKIVTIPYYEGATGVITTLITDAYTYTGSIYLDSTTLAYKMIFVGEDYWLASRYSYADSNGITFGVRRKSGGEVTDIRLFASKGFTLTSNYGVRAVVTLAADVELVESITKSGTYDLKVIE